MLKELNFAYGRPEASGQIKSVPDLIDFDEGRIE